MTAGAADLVVDYSKQRANDETLRLLFDVVRAAKVEERCGVVAGGRDGLRTAITKKARETKTEVNNFMKTYLEDAEALDGLEFLSMAEAGEMAHWEILETLNETAKDRDVADLVKFAIPLQRDHVTAVHEHSLRLAADEDPAEAA